MIFSTLAMLLVERGDKVPHYAVMRCRIENILVYSKCNVDVVSLY